MSGLHLDEHFRSAGFYYVATVFILLGIVGSMNVLRLGGVLSDARFYSMSVMLVLVHYFFHLSSNAINYPVYDDQGAILDFLLKYNQSSSWSERISLLFLPYNESMVVFPKLIALGWYKIFGEVNFRNMILFNGMLLTFFHFYLFRITTKIISPLMFLVVSLFIFQFQPFDDIFWVLSGFCFYVSFILAAIAFRLLGNGNRRSGFIALMLSVIATFTFGNGWLLFPLGISILIRGKKNAELIPWLAVFFLSFLVLYLKRSEFHPLSEVNLNPVDGFLFVLIFLGSAFQFGYVTLLPVLAGMFIIAALVIILRKKQFNSSPEMFWMLVFIIASAVTAAPLRSGIEPYGHYGMQVRYGIFSIFAFTISLALLNENLTSRKRSGILFSAAVIYQLLTGVFFFPEAVIRKEKIETVIEGIRNNIYDVRYTTYNRNDIEVLMKEAVAKGIYNP